MATACGSPALIIAWLFFIHEYNQSFSYLAETPLRAGPTKFRFSLWQAAHWELNKDFPFWMSGSCAFKLEKNKVEKNKIKPKKVINRILEKRWEKGWKNMMIFFTKNLKKLYQNFHIKNTTQKCFYIPILYLFFLIYNHSK